VPELLTKRDRADVVATGAEAPPPFRDEPRLVSVQRQASFVRYVHPVLFRREDVESGGTPT
jgi:hypothetical protein